MKDKFKNIILIILFLMLIIFGFILNVLEEDKAMSISERRYLKQLPKIENLFKGSYSNEFEEYAMDQFIRRDDFRRIKELFHFNVLRQNDNNGLFIQGGSIYKQVGSLNEKEIDKAILLYKKLANKYFNDVDNIYFSIIPDKTYYLEDNDLRIDYELLESKMVKGLYEKMSYIDIMDILDETNYYRTDSHWKQEELKPVADYLLKELGTNKSLTIDSIEEKGEFLGVYGNQLIGSNVEKDKLKYIVNDTIKSAYTYNYETNQNGNVYDEDKWSTSTDKYDYFVSGAAPIIEIVNTLNKDGKELIMFRDSYGSSIAPLLLEGYSKIILIDSRYIHSNFIQNIISFDDLENTDILFIHSTTILNEASILK